MPNGVKATRTKTTFQMEVAVSATIQATPERIWTLLTNAKDFPRWNSAVQSIEGDIALGETIALKATIAPERTFKLRVTAFEPNSTLIWQDGAAPFFKGVRRYTLTPQSGGTTVFSMVETFSGLMLPMIARSLPDFRASFEQYATDLKAEAERVR